MKDSAPGYTDRPQGRGGGRRDPVEGKTRGSYVTAAFDAQTAAWVIEQAADRGLSKTSFAGMIVEAARRLSPEDLDDFLAGDSQ